MAEKALTPVVRKAKCTALDPLAGFLVRAIGMVGISKGQVIRLVWWIDDKKACLARPIDPPWPARRPSYRLRPSQGHEDPRVQGPKCHLAALALLPKRAGVPWQDQAARRLHVSHHQLCPVRCRPNLMAGGPNFGPSCPPA